MSNKRIHPRIEHCISTLLQPFELHWFFFFLNRVAFYDWTDKRYGLPTMCATVIDMRLAICYNTSFVDELDDDELRFLILHELFHHLHHHLERGKNFNRDKANIAMDMVINHLIITHYHKMRNGYIISKMPVFSRAKCEEMVAKAKSLRELTAKESQEIMALEGKATGCMLDPNYKGVLAFEPLYDWLMQEHDKSKRGESHELSPGTKRMLDNADLQDMMMDVHIQMDEVGEDIKKQLVEEAVAKSRMEVSKTRGSVPGDVEEVLNLLLKAPKKNNIKLLKRSLSSLKGKIKEKSWKRLNRRVPGLKGRQGISQEINAILDVSGSMWGTFDLVLREIFRDNLTINLIEADTQITSIQKITNKRQLSKFKLKGGGGTELSPAVRYVINPSNGFSRYSSVLLTDGYCDSIDFSGATQDWLIITTGDLVRHNGGARIRQIKVEQ